MPAAPGWDDAVLTATLFAIDPAGLTWQVRASAGPARDALLAMLRAALPQGTPMRRCPLGIGDDRLLGGLDLAATLARGRRVAQHGLLAEADGGVLVLPMAERLTREMAARLCPVLDTGALQAERDGVALRDAARLGLLLLDESVADEAPPASLLERAAFRTLLDGLPATTVPAPDLASRVTAAARLLPQVRVDAPVIEALCNAAQAFGIASLRAPMMALRVARAAAALDGRVLVEDRDAVLAARLVLAWRATRRSAALPEPDQSQPDQPEPEHNPDAAPDQDRELPPDQDTPDRAPSDQAGAEQARDTPDARPEDRPGGLDERVLEAVQAAMPADLLDRLQARSGVATGASDGGRVAAGPVRASPHGRPLLVRAGRPERGKRLAVVETLRAAAPWQAVRREARARSGTAARRVEVRVGDFRIVQCEQRPRNIAIFVVDASGSAAMGRLAEAKGAIERLLADCYVRRDRVALIAFRGRTAELLLPPTGALTRARRSLAGLPGGGGTPIAAGLDAATALALSLRARGETPLVVMLTDGRANITRGGIADRVRAGEEAALAAGRLRASGVASLLVDMSPRLEAKAEALAAKMGALYLKLPDAESMSRAVREAAA